VHRLDDPDAFVEWVRGRLAERRISIRQLAAKAGVDASTVSRILAGERRPTLTTAVKVARALRATHIAGLDLRATDDDPVRRVEAALRSDASLDPDSVATVMAIYLANREARADGLRRHVRVRLTRAAEAGRRQRSEGQSRSDRAS
jgi:transcriptional regulator with XRE-family HTH domain